MKTYYIVLNDGAEKMILAESLLRAEFTANRDFPNKWSKILDAWHRDALIN